MMQPSVTLPMLPELPELTEHDLADIAAFSAVVSDIVEKFRETINAFAAMVPTDAIAELDAALRRVHEVTNELEFERRYARQRRRKQRRVRRGR